LWRFLNRQSLTSPLGCSIVLLAAVVGAALGVWVSWPTDPPARPIDGGQLLSVRVRRGSGSDQPAVPLRDADARRRFAAAIERARPVPASPAGEPTEADRDANAGAPPPLGVIETLDAAGGQRRYVIRGPKLVEYRGTLLRLPVSLTELLDPVWSGGVEQPSGE
jgi:hypothetical protein